MTQHAPQNLITALTLATVKGKAHWSADANGRLAILSSEVQLTLHEQDGRAVMTISGGPPQVYSTHSGHHPELLSLMHLARRQADEARDRILQLAWHLYGGIPRREIPQAPDDPEGLWQLCLAAAHATAQDRLHWQRLDTHRRITYCACLQDVAGQPLLQLDLLDHAREEGPPVLLFTLSSNGRPLGSATESRGQIREDRPLLLLLQAVTSASARRRAEIFPDRENPEDDPQLAQLIRTFLTGVS